MAAQAPSVEATAAAGRLRGKVAVVVGASRGMGRAIALGYASEGAQVVVVARGATDLHQVAAEAASFGQRCVSVVADARDGEQLGYAANRVADEFGRVDVLVHSVGGGLSAAGLERPALLEELNANRGADFWRIDDEVFESIVALDLKSAFLTCKYFAPMMIQQQSGSIIVLGSYGGIMGSRGWKDVASQMCKAGVHRLVAAMADELRPYGVAANILLPGLTLTNHTAAIAALRERVSQKPEDCVDAAVFLATQDHEGMTGRFVEANPSPARLPVPYMPISAVLAGKGSGAVPEAPRESDGLLVKAPKPRDVGIPDLRVPGLAALRLGATQRSRHAGRALRHPSLRLFFLGQSFSLPGTWMQRMAIAWLAYQLTGSAVVLGMLEVAFQIPALLFGPLAGVAADRWSRKSLLLWTQSLSMALAAILATLVFMGLVGVWHLAVFSLIQGILAGFDQTARRALLFDMVEGEREDLASAIALNSTLQMAARAIGPAVGGLLIAAFGGAICFLLNSVSFLPVIASLVVMRISMPTEQMRQPARSGALWEGLRYTLGHVVIRDALFLLAMGSLFGIAFMVLLPLFAAEILSAGAAAFGFLAAAFGAGSLLGAAYVAGYTSAARLQWLIAVGIALLGVGLLGLGFAQTLWLAVLFTGLAGFGAQLLITGTSTVVQTHADDDKRGRVMSWYTTAFNGAVPLGSLGAGALAATMGTGSTLLVGAAACLLAAAAASYRLAGFRLQAPSRRGERAVLPSPPRPTA